jgi:glycosyltransferase involved in cell wall biosynthesis
VLSSTRKERDGVAEYTRQLFRPALERGEEVTVRIADITPGRVLAAPFQGMDVVHIQHEFFMFDRLVGVSALLYYPYLWLGSLLKRYRIVSTIHSTYNVDDLEGALPHFRKYRWLFPAGRLYLRMHLWLVSKLSSRVFILSKVGLENMARVLSQRDLDRRVRYTHLGNYASGVRMRRHGLLASRFGLAAGERMFTLFGFAFPIKGYEYAIQALDLLVHQRGRRDVRLVIVSGETGKASFPGGGQGESYLGFLRRLTAERKLEPHVVFTGYLPNDDPLLEEIFAETFCFVFPYLDRNFPSGAISTVLATGKPVLVTNIRCFQEYEDLPAFQVQDAGSLADAMATMMDDPQCAGRAAEITRRNADKFDMRHIFARHLEAYRELCPRCAIVTTGR